MKKLLAIILLGLVFSGNAYTKEELWKCEKNLGDNVFSMVPVWVLPNQKKLIFLDKLKYTNGDIDESIYKYHEFKNCRRI